MSKELKDAHDLEKLLKSRKPIAIFFYMEGCPHCKNMEEPWEHLAEKEKPDFYKVESEHVPDELGIYGYPHYMMVEGGRKKKSFGGEMTEPELKSKLLGGSLGGKRTRRRGARRLRRRTGKVTH